MRTNYPVILASKQMDYNRTSPRVPVQYGFEDLDILYPFVYFEASRVPFSKIATRLQKVIKGYQLLIYELSQQYDQNI